mmetsp:Transcript_27626/g.42290  ORF Transcript_27626/g.42290 Transcript_27626/m.42290 type:complete len:318 (-) Transcript_27626:744-1697(-)
MPTVSLQRCITLGLDIADDSFFISRQWINPIDIHFLRKVVDKLCHCFLFRRCLVVLVFVVVLVLVITMIFFTYYLLIIFLIIGNVKECLGLIILIRCIDGEGLAKCPFFIERYEGMPLVGFQHFGFTGCNVFKDAYLLFVHLGIYPVDMDGFVVPIDKVGSDEGLNLLILILVLGLVFRFSLLLKLVYMCRFGYRLRCRCGFVSNLRRIRFTAVFICLYCNSKVNFRHSIILFNSISTSIFMVIFVFEWNYKDIMDGSFIIKCYKGVTRMRFNHLGFIGMKGSNDILLIARCLVRPVDVYRLMKVIGESNRDVRSLF